MTVTHIVSFQFKQGTKPDSVAELISRMLALKETCLHPSTGKPYLTTCAGGRDNSVQGLQNGLTHVFVVTFDTVEERDYYALEDPVHLEFVNWSDTVVQQVQAIDFVDGEFGSHGI
ncbi:Stress-response A/B barrel domain-containing protein [Fusarium sp. Ph1]|nr:Stress-response A/B barrel domain-containing protein [Fusarium sp. Ph1]